MYTSCPECGTVFRISTNDLRVAEGYVRCGHCSATFNALATLADELPHTVTLKQLTLPTEPGAAAAGGREAEPAGVPALPAADDHVSPPELAAAAAGQLTISEDTLEFDIPEERWSNFFEPNGPDAVAPPVAQPDGGVDTSDTVDQAGPYRVLADDAVDPRLDDDGDWQALLDEVQDDEAAPDSVYVIGEEPPAKATDEPGAAPVLPAASWDDPLPGASRLPAALPADFAADLPGAGSTGAGSETLRGPRQGAREGSDLGIRTDDRPFLWKPPDPHTDVRSGRNRAYTAGSVLLVLLLLIQVLHQQRDELATSPALTEPLQRIYGALGLPLWPAWDLKAYELRNSEAVADRSSPGALDILARIAVVGNDPVGLPLVRVTLRDRLSRPLGSRVFQPDEYIRAKAPPRKVVSPGTLIPVEISLRDPGVDAQGFDVDVCVMSRRAGVVCRVDREPFVR